MPWDRIHYPEGTLSRENRDAIAKGTTAIYDETYPTHGIVGALSLSACPSN
jgi:hypothetical protein